MGMKYVLAIAGSDSCGGAGIQADIKTITRLDCHALTVITAVTAQNSLGITAIHPIPATFIATQIETILDDLSPQAVKVGMLLTAGAVEEVIRALKVYRMKNVVVDPLMRASTGRKLINEDAVPLLMEGLFPLATVVTPNLEEAGMLTGTPVRDVEDMEQAALSIHGLGPLVVVTGGHLEGRCVDVLYDGEGFHYFDGPKIKTENDHGSGCVFSSALATCLAGEGDPVRATARAHALTRAGIMKGYPCGRGRGAVRP
jgi:hydroxymethylpyrimidine/phosphomethylpyrimidine kinase